MQRGIPGKGCIDNALALVGLKDTGKKKAKDFSLGMRQRLALAIALLGNPEFLVLDEPINGLDPTGIIELRNLLKRRKRTIITRAEQSYGRVPFAGLCRLFISVYVPGAGLPGARASAFPAPHGSEICPDRAAYSAPAIDTHKAQCRWPWPFPPANTQWHWIPRP